MKKLVLVISFVALSMINSIALSGSSGESTAEMAINAKAAQKILNQMACKDKKPGEKIKDQTSGKMIVCPELKNNSTP